MVVSYGSMSVGILFRGGILTDERMCFTFVRNTGEAASCLVEGGGRRKGMRSQVVIVMAIPSLIPGLDGRTHRWGRINTQKYGDPWYKFLQ